LVERSFVIPFIAPAKGGLTQPPTISPITLARAGRIYHSKALRAFSNIANFHPPIALARSTICDSIPLVFVFLPAKIFIARTDQSLRLR
jgi:hypothetical protein